MGFINYNQLMQQAALYAKSGYGTYLKQIKE
jgi:hypothetical protein